jgi:hypothetical protein
MIPKDKFTNLGWDVVKMMSPGYIIDNQPVILVNRTLWQNNKVNCNHIVSNILKSMELDGDGFTKYKVVGQPITIPNKSYIGLLVMKTTSLSILNFDILSLNVLFNQEPVNKNLITYKLRLKREMFEYLISIFGNKFQRKITKYENKMKIAKLQLNNNKTKKYKKLLFINKQKLDKIKELLRFLVLSIPS